VRLDDPYAVPGVYRKAQLHAHTRRSDGRFEPAELARRYRDAGYAFLCFTDHEVVTRCDELNDGAFLALPGVEEAVGWGPLPLGPHLGRLLVDRPSGGGAAAERVARTLAAGGVPSLHHPSWTGNLRTGGWTVAAVAALPGPYLIEIWNPHSAPVDDLRRWARAARAHGPSVRVTAVAADDCHEAVQFDRGWVMVKVPELSAAALRRALLGGACYASTGVVAEFGAAHGAVVARADADLVLFFDADGRERARATGGTARYAPVGDEGFVRVECRAGERRAWSQAFWVLP
jgi:HAMP domain-containing protein